MIENTPDPAEEYFNTLARMDADDPKWQEFVSNTRDEYRVRSRYTDAYWNQRENYLRQKAIARVEIPMKAHSVSPKLYNLLTARTMPLRYQIAYFAREIPRSIVNKISKLTHRSTQ